MESLNPKFVSTFWILRSLHTDTSLHRYEKEIAISYIYIFNQYLLRSLIIMILFMTKTFTCLNVAVF